jgi:hypothetical protein
MALWGNKDGAPFGSLTATVAANPGLNLLTFSGSISSYGIQPGNTIIVDTAGTPQFVRVKQVISETIVETTTNMTAVSAVDCEFQQSPKYTSIEDVVAGNIVGADLSEVAAGGTTDPGWLRKYTKTRDGVTVTLYETLVASSSINEDVVNDEFGLVQPDIINITQDPQDISVMANVGEIQTTYIEDVVWSVTTSGPNTTFYDWQWSIDSGANFSSVSVDGQPPGFAGFYRESEGNSLVTDDNQENVRIQIYPDFILPSENYDNIRFRVRVYQGTTEVISNSAQIIRVG